MVTRNMLSKYKKRNKEYKKWRTTYQPVLTTFLQPQHIPTQGYNITQSSAPDDGHMVARNMLNKYKKRNKEYKKWHLVGFSYPHQTLAFNEW